MCKNLFKAAEKNVCRTHCNYVYKYIHRVQLKNDTFSKLVDVLLMIIFLNFATFGSYSEIHTSVNFSAAPCNVTK